MNNFSSGGEPCDCSKVYEEKFLPTINQLNMNIPSKQIVAILGKNGSGKSTLLKILAGIIPNYDGRLDFYSNDLKKLDKFAFYSNISYLPQDMKAVDITAFEYLSYQDVEIENILWLAKYLHIDLSKNLMEMSGGQLQAVNIAFSLGRSSAVYLLDEPLTHLDYSTQKKVLTFLSFLVRSRKKTVVMILHDAEHALRYSDRVLLLEKGGERLKEIYVP